MYLLYCLLIFTFVYTLPALACMPKLIYSPLTAFAIPILSALLIYILTTVLIACGAFSAQTVMIVALGCGAIAIKRLISLLRHKPLSWSTLDKKIYLFHAMILLPYFIKLGTHAFDRGDEIYSWNFWALQHVFNEAIDFSHTGAPYPQLFPKLLAFCYQLLGNIELQLPVKATLIVFPWALLTGIAMTFRQQFAKSTFLYAIGFAYVLWGVGLAQFFDDGYADPIMTSALGVSAVFFWFSQHRLSRASFYFGILAVLSAWVCAHAKQAGLLWAGFALPILFLSVYRREKDKRYAMLALAAFSGAMVWIAGEGQTFHHNDGVLWLSFGERGVFKQLAHSIDRYFIHQPLLLGLFIYTCWVSQKNKILKQMLWLFLLPGWVCWFLFGAYQLRLGQHLIAFAFFMMVAAHYPFLSFATVQQRWQQKQKAIYSGLIVFSIAISSVLFIKEVYIEKNGVSLYQGGRQSLHRYFGKEADMIYQQVYLDPKKLLWVPSRYIYGLFYKHTQLTSPDYDLYAEYNTKALVDELKRKSPDYVFTVSEAVIDGPASEVLTQVIQQCPHAFQKISGPKNRFNFMTYKLNKKVLETDPCLVALQADRFPSASQLSLAPIEGR